MTNPPSTARRSDMLTPENLSLCLIAIGISTVAFSVAATSGVYGPGQGVTGADGAGPLAFVAVLLAFGLPAIGLLLLGVFGYLVALTLIYRRTAPTRIVAILIAPVILVPLWIFVPPPFRIDNASLHYSVLTAVLVSLFLKVEGDSPGDGSAKRDVHRMRP